MRSGLLRKVHGGEDLELMVCGSSRDTVKEIKHNSYKITIVVLPFLTRSYPLIWFWRSEESICEEVSRVLCIKGREEQWKGGISGSFFRYRQEVCTSINCRFEWERFRSRLRIRCLIFWKLMAQVKVQMGSVKVVRTATVNIEALDVERRIRQFDLTLIGRVWNPQFDNMDSLLYHMPKIWKLEDKVVGHDLGDGKFHFQFQSEPELIEVLRNAPYHYDSWMVSVVRWEPSVAEDYPSEIKFWARVKGLPFQYGAADSLWNVGEALGTASEVDEDAGYVRVAFNGFEPLVSTVVIPYSYGDEVKVFIAYDKLANHCQHCFRLTHLASYCPELNAQVLGIDGMAEGSKKLKEDSVDSGDHRGWEQVRRKSVKRTHDVTEVVDKADAGQGKEVGRTGNAAHEKNGNGQRDGRGYKREFHRGGSWESHGQGRGGKHWVASSHNGQSYRGRDGRPLT